MESATVERRHTVVTSFSPDGYERYGKEFIRSFKQFWPSSVRLELYLDDPVPDLEWDGQVGLAAFLDDCDMPAWAGFEKKLFPIMTGNTAQGYNIQYDARMARKTFIQYDALMENKGKVFWIDADVVTHSPVPETFLDEMLPDDKFSCYLGRDGWMYTESGFLGFNGSHPGCEGFMKFYRSLFTNGYIFLQKAWHDCIAYDWARSVHDKSWFHNLAAGLPHGTMHPFVNSRLGAYCDHLKGNRKGGRSSKADLVVARTEPYWCDA